MREVELLTERVVFLAHGQVIADASAAEIAATFGHDDLEGVFLEIADQHRDDPVPVEPR
jgi:ABC-type Na+ transport system ATPase subunit NatA